MVTLTVPEISHLLDEQLIARLKEAEKPYLRVVQEGQGDDDVKAILAEAPPFKRVIVIGMGGSILGTRAAAYFAGKEAPLLYVDNLDAARITRAAGVARTGEAFVVAISKSGGTLETLANLAHLLPPLKEAHGEDWKKYVAVVTANPEGTIGKWAAEEGVGIIGMPLDLSGRFSLFSTVGTLPLRAARFDVETFREGALRGYERVLGEGSKPFLDLLATLLARPKSPLVLFTYGTPISLVGDWFRQLWAESLGKEGKFGQMPMTAVGTADQHSILQMVLDVPDATTTWVWHSPERGDVVVGDEAFGILPLKVGRYLDAAGQGLTKALAERGVNHAVLRVDALDESSVGELFMTLMLLTHAASFVLDVPTFNQPAVELAKKFTKAIVEEFRHQS